MLLTVDTLDTRTCNRSGSSMSQYRRPTVDYVVTAIN